MNTPESITSAVRAALIEQINTIIAAEAKAAAVRVEERVRASAGAIAATVLTHFTMDVSYGQLCIRVDFKNTNT